MHDSTCSSANISATDSLVTSTNGRTVDAYRMVISRLLAQGKKTEMSSLFSPSFTSDKAVDGIYIPTNGDSSSLMHTENEENPWWRVDLAKTHCISAVNILNRVPVSQSPNLAELWLSKAKRAYLTFGRQPASAAVCIWHFHESQLHSENFGTATRLRVKKGEAPFSNGVVPYSKRASSNRKTSTGGLEIEVEVTTAANKKNIFVLKQEQKRLYEHKVLANRKNFAIVSHEESSDDNLLTSHTSSKIQCAAKCTLLKGCIGFAYEIEEKMCTLFSGMEVNPDQRVAVNTEQLFLLELDRLLARGRPVVMSSVLGPKYKGRRAVDGVYEPPSFDLEQQSIAHTESEMNPWLRVDLEKRCIVISTRIRNRGGLRDAIWQKAVDVMIMALTSENNLFFPSSPDTLCGKHSGYLNQHYTTITCHYPMVAQFVQMQLGVNGFLNIYEFEVHGYPDVAMY
ncbi:uncharacterized protein [Watersipora subatra]|uniref:uncharacterized protein n=1 Tax=Watersipora subatra TaxID=2589382 RepID=UPI00355BA673